MTDWFARPVLHVKDVDASLRFYIDRLGFTTPWRFAEDGRAYVAQVDRQGCSLILSNQWPEKVGKGLMFISLNVDPIRARPRSPRWTRCARNSRPRALRSRTVRGATGFLWSMIPTAISSSSIIRPRLRPSRLREKKHDRRVSPSRDARQRQRANAAILDLPTVSPSDGLSAAILSCTLVWPYVLAAPARLFVKRCAETNTCLASPSLERSNGARAAPNLIGLTY